MPEIRRIAQQLEQIAAKLKETTDPAMRRELLREMRSLLAEADRLLVERPE